MSDTTYPITKFGVNISNFTSLAMRIITPNRELGYSTTAGLVAEPVWDDTLIAAVANNYLGVYIFTIPADLPAGNDYDILFYDTTSADPVAMDAPYDGRKLVWTGSSIASLTDYVGNDVTFKLSPMGGGFGF